MASRNPEDDASVLTVQAARASSPLTLDAVAVPVTLIGAHDEAKNDVIQIIGEVEKDDDELTSYPDGGREVRRRRGAQC